MNFKYRLTYAGCYAVIYNGLELDDHITFLLSKNVDPTNITIEVIHIDTPNQTT